MSEIAGTTLAHQLCAICGNLVVGSSVRVGEAIFHRHCLSIATGASSKSRIEELEQEIASADALYKAYADNGYRRGIEAAAKIIEENQEAVGGDIAVLTPRMFGDQHGLAFARAIRALISQPKDAT